MGNIISFVIYLAIQFAVAYFAIYPAPFVPYESFMDGLLYGLGHGVFAPYNYVISSFIDPDRLYIASEYGLVYQITFWIGGALSVVFAGFSLVGGGD